jgi:hypothetical protein
LKKTKKRVRESAGGVVRVTTFNGGGREKIPAVKVPRQCPLVLSVKVD